MTMSILPATCSGNVLLPRRITRTETVENKPSPARVVPPSLRFMLAPDALDEAERLRRHMYQIRWEMMTIERRIRFMEEQILALLPSQYPFIARADQAIGGTLAEAFRAVGMTPEMPGWWRSILLVMSNGHPEKLRRYCMDVIDFARSRISVRVDDPMDWLDAHPASARKDSGNACPF